MKTKWQLIISFLKNNRWLTTVAFINGLGYNILTLVIPVCLGRFYEFNFGFYTHRLSFFKSVTFLNFNSFTNFFIFFIMLILVRFIFDFFNKYFISIIGEAFAKNLREQLFEHQLQISTHIYNQKGIGKYLLRYSGDLKSIQNYITKGLFRFSQDLFLITILLITISFIDISLSIIVALSIGISIILLYFFNNYLYKVSVDRRNQRAGMLSFINTRLRSIISIKVFNKYTPEQKRFVKRSENLYTIGKKYQYIVSLIQAIIPTLTYLMLALLMGYVYYIKTNQSADFNASALLILILLIISFLPILRRVLRISVVWKLGNISFEKLLNILALDAENKIPFKKINLVNKAINFSEVSFKYTPTDPLVFNKMNFTIPFNRLTLIIGDSGSGKNTFINLLLKIHAPTSGTIYYGKNKHLNLGEKTIRKNISVVSDEFPLYGKNIYEAIVYSRKSENEKKVAYLLNDLQQFEETKNKMNLKDNIGDLGCKLTKGQKIILMYCRALLTDKPWLIINHPFRNLNNKTANKLKTVLNYLKQSKSIIILNTNKVEGLKTDNVYYIKNNTISS